MRRTITKVFCDPCLADGTENTEAEEIKIAIGDVKGTLAFCAVHQKELLNPLTEAVEKLTPAPAAKSSSSNSSAGETCPVCNKKFARLAMHRSRAGH